MNLPFPKLLLLNLLLISCTTGNKNTAIMTAQPDTPTKPQPQRIATTPTGFCIIQTDGKIRCRYLAPFDLMVPQHVPPPNDPNKTYRQIASYDAGFCALADDQSVDCWNAPSQHLGVVYEFPGQFVELHEGPHALCARDVHNQTLCAQIPRDHLSGTAKYSGTTKPIRALLVEQAFETLSGPRTLSLGHTPSSVKTTELDVKGQYIEVLHTIDPSGTLSIDGQPHTGTNRHHFVDIATRRGTTCALRDDDTVHCYGELSYDDDFIKNVDTLNSGEFFIQTNHGFLGLANHHRDRKGNLPVFGSDDPRNATFKEFKDVQHGNDFGCGLRTDGKVECWGTILGHRLAPPPKTRMKSIALSGHVACGIAVDDAHLECWSHVTDAEAGSFGEIKFTQSVKNQRFVEIKTSYQNLCARREDNTILCFGARLPANPFEVPIKSPLFEVSSPGVCAVDKTQNLACWGYGYRW